MKIICYLRSLWWSLRANANVSGHDFREIDSPPHTQILKCQTCGHESIGYYRP